MTRTRELLENIISIMNPKDILEARLVNLFWKETVSGLSLDCGTSERTCDEDFSSSQSKRDLLKEERIYPVATSIQNAQQPTFGIPIVCHAVQYYSVRRRLQMVDRILCVEAILDLILLVWSYNVTNKRAT